MSRVCGESVAFPGLPLLCSPPPKAILSPPCLPAFPGFPLSFWVNETEAGPLPGFVSRENWLLIRDPGTVCFLSMVAITGVTCSQFTGVSDCHCGESQEARWCHLKLHLYQEQGKLSQDDNRYLTHVLGLVGFAPTKASVLACVEFNRKCQPHWYIAFYTYW